MPVQFDQYLPVRAFNNVAPDNEAFAEILPNMRYHRLYVEVGGHLANGDGSQGALITDFAQAADHLAIELNSKDRRILTPAQLRQLNGINGAKYNGTDAKVLIFHFREDWLWNHLGAEYLSLGFVGLLRFVLKVKLKAGVHSDITLKAWVEADKGYDISPDGKILVGPMPLGYIKHTAKDTFQVSGDTLKLPAVAWKGLVRRLHMFSPNIAKVRFVVANEVLYEYTRAQLAKILYQNDLVDNPNVFVIPFDATMRVTDGIPAAALRDAEIEVTFNPGTGASFDMVQEYVDLVA